MVDDAKTSLFSNPLPMQVVPVVILSALVSFVALYTYYRRRLIRRGDARCRTVVSTSGTASQVLRHSSDRMATSSTANGVGIKSLENIGIPSAYSQHCSTIDGDWLDVIIGWVLAARWNESCQTLMSVWVQALNEKVIAKCYVNV